MTVHTGYILFALLAVSQVSAFYFPRSAESVKRMAQAVEPKVAAKQATPHATAVSSHHSTAHATTHTTGTGHPSTHPASASPSPRPSIDFCDVPHTGGASTTVIPTDDTDVEANFSLFACVATLLGGSVLSNNEIDFSVNCKNGSSQLEISFFNGQFGAFSINDSRICRGDPHTVGVVVEGLALQTVLRPVCEQVFLHVTTYVQEQFTVFAKDPFASSSSSSSSSHSSHGTGHSTGHSTGHASTGHASTGHASTGHASTGHASTPHAGTAHASTPHGATAHATAHGTAHATAGTGHGTAHATGTGHATAHGTGHGTAHGTGHGTGSGSGSSSSTSYNYGSGGTGDYGFTAQYFPSSSSAGSTAATGHGTATAHGTGHGTGTAHGTAHGTASTGHASTGHASTGHASTGHGTAHATGTGHGTAHATGTGHGTATGTGSSSSGSSSTGTGHGTPHHRGALLARGASLDGVRITFYVDNAPLSETIIDFSTLASPANPIVLAGQLVVGNFFTGQIAPPQVFDFDLTPAQVATLVDDSCCE